MPTDTNRFNLAPGLQPEPFRAAEVKLHRITLQRARKAGELGFVRIGDRVLISDEHMTAWLSRNEHPSRNEAA